MALSDKRENCRPGPLQNETTFESMQCSIVSERKFKKYDVRLLRNLNSDLNIRRDKRLRPDVCSVQKKADAADSSAYGVQWQTR